MRKLAFCIWCSFSISIILELSIFCYFKLAVSQGPITVMSQVCSLLFLSNKVRLEPSNKIVKSFCISNVR